MSSVASTSSSDLSSSPEIPRNCLVCGLKSHGTHFGAVTCRACAAFFRRVGGGAKFVIKCRLGKDNCEVSLEGRICCKKCRLRKCKEVGMDMKKFQFDRDLISTSQKLTPSLPNFLGRPGFLIQCDPETASSRQQTKFIDFTELLGRASQVFQTPILITNTGLSQLEKLTIGLQKDRGIDERDRKLVTKVGFDESFSFWEYDLMATAKWLTCFDELQTLPIEVRMKFLKCIWHVWNRLEKLARSCLVRKNRDPNGVLLSGNCDLELANIELDLSWLSNHSVEQLAYFLEGVGDWSPWDLVPAMVELNPSDVELNFMLVQLCFDYAARQFPGEEVQKISEHLQDSIANDLHLHYVKLQMPRYSDRISKLLKMNNAIKKFLFEKSEKVTIAKTFDVFNAQVSHPEMFNGVM